MNLDMIITYFQTWETICIRKCRRIFSFHDISHRGWQSEMREVRQATWSIHERDWWHAMYPGLGPLGEGNTLVLLVWSIMDMVMIIGGA